MKKIQVHNPFNGELVGEVQRQDGKQVNEALDRAAAVFGDRSKWLSVPQRIGILEKFQKLMEANQDKLILQALSEGGKPLVDTKVEVARAINGVRVAIEAIPHLLGREIPMSLNAASMNRMAYTYREPGGLVTAISAFNHPVNLIIHHVIPAVATGCPVVVKPATKTPLSCLSLVDLLHQSGLPKDWCQAVVCTQEDADLLVTDRRLNFLTFIGSAKVGWFLRSKLAHGAQCVLEHGGVAPVIVEADANLEEAIPLLVKAGFYHAGQVCVSLQRVYAHKSIAQGVAQQMAEKAAKLVVGDPADPKTEVGPMISHAECDRVAEWVDEAVKKGATLLCGGKKISESCYAPTVLWNPPEDVRVSMEEVFGPVVCVYGYDKPEEAVKRANALPVCFQSAVFTKDIDRAFYYVRNLQATVVMVNDHTAFRVDWMPFGGRMDSGLGMGGIPRSMEDMTAEKMFVVKTGGGGELPPV
ncbi:MAG: aldehyde dehydrogenase family protein [Verrucomicrobia bacterium]|nr:aldehyde dehydrogenase family protein [Verrucomicrobiota bacterium]